MDETSTTVRVSIDLALAPTEACEVVTAELATALARGGLDLEPGPHGGVRAGDVVVGRVLTWTPGVLIRLQWHPADWDAAHVTHLEIRFAPVAGGTQIQVQQQGWGGLLGDPREVAGWFASAVAAPFIQATAPADLGEWLTDRRARRPAGAQARVVYRDPLYHYPNFQVLLQELALTPDDLLLEVGCGGGAFLCAALQSGCRAAAIDHSRDMVQLAQEVNQEAVAQGRLTIEQASAERLPFADATFTAGAMTGVLGFLPDPMAALAEIRRVLRPGGRLVVLGSDPQWRGTPAAPEPMAARLRFYEDAALGQLAHAAGFAQVQVVRRELEPFARQAGVPDEHLALFAGPGAPFLLARKA